jgi:hypothetical protein
MTGGPVEFLLLAPGEGKGKKAEEIALALQTLRKAVETDGPQTREIEGLWRPLGSARPARFAAFDPRSIGRPSYAQELAVARRDNGNRHQRPKMIRIEAETGMLTAAPWFCAGDPLYRAGYVGRFGRGRTAWLRTGSGLHGLKLTAEGEDAGRPSNFLEGIACLTHCPTFCAKPRVRDRPERPLPSEGRGEGS